MRPGSRSGPCRPGRAGTPAEVPQHVGRDDVRPVRQVRPGRVLQRGSQGLVPDPGGRPVGVLALRRQQRNAGSLWSSPNWPHTSSTNHRSVAPALLISGTIRSRGPEPRAPFPCRTCSLPNRPRSHLTSARSSLQASLTAARRRHQPAGGVVPGGRGELPAGRELLPPPGEQEADLPADGGIRSRASWRPRGRFSSSIGHSTTRPVIWWISTCAATREVQEVDLQRLRTRQPRPLRRGAQHLAEVLIGVRRLHLPDRPGEPGPDLLQVDHVRADRPVRQPGRRPREHEPGQHVRLERRQLIRPATGRASRRSRTTASANPSPPAFA